MFGWKVAPGALAVTAAALVVSVSAWPSPAAADLRDLIFGSRKSSDERRAPAVYVAEGGPRFIVDRSTDLTLLKFEGSAELWVLSPSPAPRGDIIYRDDVGRPILRFTKLGGVTIFEGVRSGGSPASFAGRTTALRLQAFNAQALLQRLAQASVRASRAAGRLIVFDAPDVTSGSEAVYADAAAVAAEAVAALAQRTNGRRTTQKIARIQLVQNGKVDAAMNGNTLVVSLTPRRGVAGRPSSRRIIAAATR